jgi:hypothetical protein
MTANYSFGAQTVVTIGSTAMAATSCSVGVKEVLLQRNGIRGTRDHYDADVRKGPQHVGGSINLEPSAADLAAIMALAVSDPTADLAEFTVAVSKAAGGQTLSGCKVSKATISGTQGGIISCALEVVGKTVSNSAASGSAVVDAIPFIFSDAVFSKAGEVHNFQLVIDNHLDAERFLNSVTLPEVVPQDRTVMLQVSVPWSDANAALYNEALNSASSGTLALNNGTNTKTFTFGKLIAPAESPDVPGKGEVLLQLNYVAVASTNTAAVAFG